MVAETQINIENAVNIIATAVLAAGRVLGNSYSSTWVADVSDQTAPPKSKTIEWNNVTQANATQLFISDNDKDGEDASEFLSLIDAGAHVRIQFDKDPGVAQTFEVLSRTDNTTFFTFDVTNVTATGGNILDGSDVIVTFITTSDIPDHGSEHVPGGDDVIPSVTGSVNGLMSSSDKTKLDGIETGATADQSDVEIETAYNNQVSVVSQVEAEAGTSTTVRRWTAERVAQAIAALESGGAVTSVAGKTGVVLLDMDDLSETASGKILTAAERTSISTAEQIANKGANNGYAPLDSSAIVPLANLPASVKTGSEYKGVYNATTNTPTLVNGTGSNGDYHRVNVAGTQDFGAGSITFFVGDIVVFDGVTTLWERSAGNPDLVISVAGKQGVVTLDMDDLSETATGKIFSDVERTKLTGIETAATADQSDVEIETAYNNQVSVVSQAEAEAGTSTTVRRWTAERVAQAIAALETGGGGGGTDFIFAYDTSTQGIVAANTFQDVTFSANGPLDGWTHTAGSALFTCSVTGVYACTVELSVDSGSNGNTQTNMKALFNGIEIAGSHRGVDIIHKNSAFPLDRNFMFNGTASQDLKIQWAAEDDNNNNIQPGPSPGTVVTAISATITIRRIS